MLNLVIVPPNLSILLKLGELCSELVLLLFFLSAPKWMGHYCTYTKMIFAAETHLTHMKSEDWRKRMKEWQKQRQRSGGILLQRYSTYTFFISHRVKKEQVIEKEIVQQPIRHRCQWKALLEYYNRSLLLDFLHIGGLWNNGFFNGNTWKVFPALVSCIIVSAQIKLYCFSLD